MAQAKIGDTVRVHYHGRLNDGTTFDSSEGREPLQFKVGSGQVIKGFDNGVIGMNIGEKKTVNIPAAEAYGQPDEKNFLEYPKSDFPEGMTPEVGLELHVSDEQGNQYPVVISEIKGETVVLDANHPLAGKDLIFDIELVSVNIGV